MAALEQQGTTTSTTWLFVGVCTLLFVLLLKKLLGGSAKKVPIKGGKPIPYVASWIPWLGVGLSIHRKGGEYFRELVAKYGRAFSYTAAGLEMTLIYDLEFMKPFYYTPIEQLSFFEGLEVFHFSDVIPLGASGPEESNVGIKTLKRFSPKFNVSDRVCEEEMDYLIDLLPESGELDLQWFSRRLVLACTLRILAGKRICRNEEFFENMRCHEQAGIGAAFTPRAFNGKYRKQANYYRERTLPLFLDEIKHRREHLDDGDDEGDFLTLYMKQNLNDGTPITDEILASDLFGYSFATIANTYAAVTTTILQTLNHPEFLEAARKEVDHAFEQHGALSVEALREMKWLYGITAETLRLTAPILHVRYTMKDWTVGDYFFPKGMLVGVSPYLIHRDPEIYPNPDKFDPSRWFDTQAKAMSSFIVFGQGVHVCVGKTLAEMEVKMATAKLLHRLEFVNPAQNETLEMNPLTLGLAVPAARHCTVRYKKREPAS